MADETTGRSGIGSGSVSERRRRRSSFASEALHLQLLEVAIRYKLDAIVLRDTLGHLWAASSLDPGASDIGAGLDPAELSPAGRDLFEGQGPRPVLMRRLRVGPATLFLSAQGSRSASRQAVAQAAPGVERILGGLLEASA
jgi:hypothetical protein